MEINSCEKLLKIMLATHGTDVVFPCLVSLSYRLDAMAYKGNSDEQKGKSDERSKNNLR